MNEKLSVKNMSIELESLRSRIRSLEQKLESALSQAIARLKGSSRDTQIGTGTGLDELVISVISNEYRRELIAKTAYLRAEQRGFEGGSPEQDWLEAEAEVNSYLMERHAPATMQTAAAAERASATAERRTGGTLTLPRP